MTITMCETVGDHVKGTSCDLEDAKAQQLVDAGLAEVVEDEATDLLAEASAVIEEKINKAVAKISSSMKSINVKVPAQPKEDDKSFAESIQCTGKNINKDSRVRETARSRAKLSSLRCGVGGYAPDWLRGTNGQTPTVLTGSGGVPGGDFAIAKGFSGGWADEKRG